VGRLPARRRARVDDRLTGTGRHEPGHQHRPFVLGRAQAGPVGRLPRLPGRGDDPAALGQEGRGPGRDARLLQEPREALRLPPQGVEPDGARRRAVVGLAQLPRLLHPEAVDPPPHEPEGVGRPEGDPLGAPVVLGHPGPQVGEPPQDGVHQSDGARMTDALGELDALRAGGGGGDPVKEEDLVRAQPQDRPHGGGERLERPAEDLREGPVHLRPVPQRAEGQIGGEGFVRGAELPAVERPAEQHAAPRPVGVDTAQDLQGHLPGRAGHGSLGVPPSLFPAHVVQEEEADELQHRGRSRGHVGEGGGAQDGPHAGELLGGHQAL
jgi:hypothetical protein